MLDVTFTFVQAGNFTIVDIDTQHAETDSIIAKHQRQADIAKSHDPNQSFSAFKLLYAGLLLQRHP
ncbi:hypothetical protein D3C77_703070 [compost metagenome]